MDTALGILGLILFMAVIVGFAAGITWAVTKLSPTKDKAEKKAAAG